MPEQFSFDLYNNSLLGTNLSGALSRCEHGARDIYEYPDDRLLMVTTDRMYALSDFGVPDKGVSLNQLSLLWFKLTEDSVRNNLLPLRSAPVFDDAANAVLEDRTIWCRKTPVLPIKFVVRRSAAGLEESEPVFVPTTTLGLRIGMDEVQYRIAASLGAEFLSRDDRRHANDLATEARTTSLELFGFAARYAASRGLFLASTSFRFGLVERELVLMPELLTPESSCYLAGATGRLSFGPRYLDNLNPETREPAATADQAIGGISRAYRELHHLLVASRPAYCV